MYVVIAHRWGEFETYSYIVGVFEMENKAIFAAEKEAVYRGGKYGCRVNKVEVDDWTENNVEHVYDTCEMNQGMKDNGAII